MTVEDNVLQGGFGSAVLEALGDASASVLRIGIPDRFVEHGASALLYDHVGLSAPKIAERVAEWMKGRSANGVEFAASKGA